MTKDNIILPLYSPTNLAHRKRPPKHLRDHREDSSETSSSSDNTTIQSDFDSRSSEADTRATTPELVRTPRFHLRDLFRDPSIFSTHKFIDFRPSPLPHFRPAVHQGRLRLPRTPFRHISHTHSLEHEHYCKDPRCTAHVSY
jgi:hypothetical protein